LTINSSHLYQEIHEQPQVIQRLIDNELDVTLALGQQIHERNISHFVIAARGTSDNAARYANYVLGARNRILVSLATPSLFSVFKQPPNLSNTLVLGISQSGKSPDIVSVVAEGKRQGALTAAITNFPQSDLASEADFVIDLNAGVEQSVAATKTYTSELAAIALLSCCLEGLSKSIEQLQAMPKAMQATLDINAHIEQIAERYRYMERCVVVGRGYNYATAYELALKLKELTFSMVEPYSSADFLHGPIALLEPGFPVVVIAPTGRMYPKMMSFMQKLQEHRAELVIISNEEEALAIAQSPLQLPVDTPEWLSALVGIIPGQLFAMYLAHARGVDVDSPRSLKKVTETI